jgi:hypothetical protein
MLSKARLNKWVWQVAAVGATCGGGLVLYACGGPAPGTIRGHLLVHGAVPGPYRVNTSPETVEVLSNGHVVAHQRIGAHQEFHFSEPPGTYTFAVSPWHWLCIGTARVTSGAVSTVNVKCQPGAPAPG